MTTEDDRKESVRSAWTRRLRQEALRMRRADVSRIVHVGIIIATYADADGTHAHPAAETLAPVCGYSRETITRAVRVLVAVGLLDRKRRPNQTALYTLLLPLTTVDWDAHLHLYTRTRQAVRKERIAQELVLRTLAERDPGDALNPFTPAYWEANPESDWRPLSDPDWTPPAPPTEWTAAQNAFRTAFPPGVPDRVPAGGSGPRSRGGVQGSGPRRGTPPDRDAHGVPDRVPAGGVHRDLPPVGDPPQDTDLVGPVPQPQVGARQAPAHDEPPPGPAGPVLQALPGGGRSPGGGHQAPLLLTVHTPPPPPLDHTAIAARMTALYGVPVPVRTAAWTAVRICDAAVGRDLADPTAHVLAVLDADPDLFRPDIPAARRHAAGAP